VLYLVFLLSYKRTLNLILAIGCLFCCRRMHCLAFFGTFKVHIRPPYSADLAIAFSSGQTPQTSVLNRPVRRSGMVVPSDMRPGRTGRYYNGPSRLKMLMTAGRSVSAGDGEITIPSSHPPSPVVIRQLEFIFRINQIDP
jgi:hypothetical protein